MRLDAKDALRGTGSTENGTLNWADTVPITAWDGVTVEAGRVTKLRLAAGR